VVLESWNIILTLSRRAIQLPVMSDSDTTAAPKRIVICCDGTWQSSVSEDKNIPSNITRLARSIARTGIDAEQKVWQQIVYYDAGVGTGSLNIIEGARQGGIGDGLAVNVIEAYNFIVLNYSPGDEIFCFGFSRGAYTARAVAGLITDIGICEPRMMQDFPELYKIYKKREEWNDKKWENPLEEKKANANQNDRTPPDDFRSSKAWKAFVEGKPANDQPKDLGYKNKNFVWELPAHGEVAVTQESRQVKVVGVFDTVGSLGIPDIQGLSMG
jgi:uncharacterized protein (DUF2235 family)